MPTTIPAELRKLLEKQQYGFAGGHTAVKICTWTKKSLLDRGFCYKQKFYGIRSHRCCQMSPAVNFCFNRCVICWREMGYGNETTIPEPDEPEDIIKNCILQQRKLLVGFKGNRDVNLKKFEEAQEPMHFAISLTGEPTIYPKLGELISRLHEKDKTTFLVTNGMLPEVLESITPPTQLYISVDAPNEALFKKIDRPTLRDGWQRLQESLSLLKKLNKKTRTTLRFTLVRGLNMSSPEQWGEIIKLSKPKFVEVKAYMFLGSSRRRLSINNMPRHHEVKEFADEICKHSGYKVIDEKQESRVVLLMKEDSPDRIMKFE